MPSEPIHAMTNPLFNGPKINTHSSSGPENKMHASGSKVVAAEAVGSISGIAAIAAGSESGNATVVARADTGYVGDAEEIEMEMEATALSKGIKTHSGLDVSDLGNKNSRIAYLDSLIQDTDDFEGDLPETPPLHSGDDSRNFPQNPQLISETVDVTISKSTTGLDPNKHSAIMFHSSQMDLIGVVSSGNLGVPSVKVKSKLSNKRMGGSLKIAKTAKFLNNSTQPKGNKFKIGHNTLVPLRESMKKMVEKISTQANDASNLKVQNMGLQQQITKEIRTSNSLVHFFI